MQVLVLRVTMRSKGMKLPLFAGSVWHGGLGAVLHDESPPAFAKLYQVSDEARLYSVVPPAGGLWPAGQRRVLQLSLFGPACASALAIMQTVVRLGRVGLRPGGCFVVERIETVSPALDPSHPPQLIYTDQDGLIALPHSSDVQTAWAKASADSPTSGDLMLRLLSPLRIKDNNKDLRVAPTAVQLLRRILSRTEQLAHASGVELTWLREHRHDWLNQAAPIALRHAQTEWHTLKRQSARSGQAMQFGGLVGQLHYTAVPPAVAAWLRLSQTLQIGGKTAFGFGGVAVTVNEAQGVVNVIDCVDVVEEMM